MSRYKNKGICKKCGKEGRISRKKLCAKCTFKLRQKEEKDES